MTQNVPTRNGTGVVKPNTGGYYAGPIFILLALWFLFGPSSASVPVLPMHRVSKSDISIAPRRKTMGDPPKVLIEGMEQTCMQCHRVKESPEVPAKWNKLMQHQHIRLSHAINVNCYECHDKDDRNVLVKRDGSKLSFADSVELCAQCHSKIHHDWKTGAHGRSNGYWNTKRGELRRLKCTECHDPHQPRSPAMDAIKPLPGPFTLRMGHQPTDPEHHVDRDPLRRTIHRMLTPHREGHQAAERAHGKNEAQKHETPKKKEHE